ncbi:hypothetical protein HYW20_01770 [Candidatus Woesearchaeota archaeon]|nr:hypothetical protein [Candidatus Woesearchaeota archaeon]
MIKNKFDPLTKKSFFLMGFFVALAMAIDLVVGGAFLAVFSFYIIFTERKNVFYYLLGTLIPVILYIILSILVTGDLLPASMHPEYFKYDGSDFLNEQNIAGVANPDSITGFFVHAFHSLFGYRGLFSYTPLFFISACCLYNLLRKKDTLFSESLACFFAINITILFYLYTDSVYGGYAYGMRYFIAFHPVLFFFTIFYFKGLTAKKLRLYYILLTISVFIALVGAYNPWADSFGYPFFLYQPVPFLNNLRFIFEDFLKFMDPSLLGNIKELI